MNEYASILQPNQMNKIKNVFDIDDIKKILESQSKPNAKRLLLILDDVLHSTLLLNNKLFLDMIANSRHYNIYTIITMQYPLGITPELRVNFGFVFIFQDNFISNKKRIYEHYFGMFSQFKLFDKIMSEYCEDYGILVADNLNHSTSFEDKVKWYKSVNVNNEYIHQIELLELETALNDIEKAMDKIETQNSTIQTKLRDLLESNKQMAKEFTDIRRGMTNKFKDVNQKLAETPGIAHDLAAVTSNTLIKIEQDMSSTNDVNDME